MENVQEIDHKLIYVNVISRNLGHWAMFTAFQQAASYASLHGYRVMLSPHVGDSLVCRARNTALQDFLDRTNAGWYFTLDDDIAIPPDCFVKLVEADKDIIGGFYRLKKDRKKGDNLAEGLAFRIKEPFDLTVEEPVEVFYISGGCVMHKRSFLEALKTYYPEREYLENVTDRKIIALYTPFIHPETREYLSEDWAFCQRAIDKGFKMWMHTGVCCEHWGLQKFNIGDLIQEALAEEGEGEDNV